MDLQCLSFRNNETIPPQFAYCAPDPKRHTTPGGNRNPHLRWSGAPEGTRSFAIICHDTDVPTRFDDANQEGRMIAASLPRRDFYHWVLADIPATVTEIKEGEVSTGPERKSRSQSAHGARAGLNDYSSDDERHFDYDGPNPPWNDERLHHYVFTVYALDVERLPLTGEFRGRDLLAAMEGHVLDKESITGVYSLNPEVRH
jgi:Raf kinase inhibitor-like YbhB/YbcL family protein